MFVESSGCSVVGIVLLSDYNSGHHWKRFIMRIMNINDSDKELFLQRNAIGVHRDCIQWPLCNVNLNKSSVAFQNSFSLRLIF